MQYTDEQRPPVDEVLTASLVHNTHAPFFLLQRSGIRVFQPTCSFYVYKQKIEIKISNEKNSEWGNPAPVQLPAYRNKRADHLLKAEVKSVIIPQLQKLKRVSVNLKTASTAK